MRSALGRAVAMALLMVSEGSFSAFGVLDHSLNIGRNRIGTATDNGGGSFTIVGAGNDIWDQVDECTFRYDEITGDFDVRVRVESLSPNARLSKAGLMIRESLAEDSRMVFERVTPPNVPTSNGDNGANDVHFSYRTGLFNVNGDNGGQHEDGLGVPAYPNAWIRLVRQGSVFSGHTGSDGINWNLQGTQDTTTWNGGAFAGKVLIGLAVSRHSGGPTATAEFRQYQLTKSANFTLGAASTHGCDCKIRLCFNHPVGAGAFLGGNYTVSGGIFVNNAGPSPTPEVVDLDVDCNVMVEGGTYTVTATGIRDSGGNPLTPDPQSITFVHGMEVDNGVVKQDYFRRNIHIHRNQIPNADFTGPPNAGLFETRSTAYELGQPVRCEEQPAIASNTLFEDVTTDDGSHKRFSVRLIGVLSPSASGLGDGNYRFAGSSDDQGFLYLSSNDKPSHKQLIAFEPVWNG
ncbi:MAG TPA: Ig-like domain-containing protein, partial [Verrucomicrobiae bacterium]